jgi:hypothetical protein
MDASLGPAVSGVVRSLPHAIAACDAITHRDARDHRLKRCAQANVKLNGYHRPARNLTGERDTTRSGCDDDVSGLGGNVDAAMTRQPIRLGNAR